MAAILGAVAGPVVSAVSGAVGKYFDHENQKLSAKEVAERILETPDILQGEIDKVAEAQPGKFSKWRDGAGWVCVAGLGWQFVVAPALTGLLGAFDVTFAGTVDTGPLVTLLLGMLGLGGMHLYEKVKT